MVHNTGCKSAHCRHKTNWKVYERRSRYVAELRERDAGCVSLTLYHLP